MHRCGKLKFLGVPGHFAGVFTPHTLEVLKKLLDVTQKDMFLFGRFNSIEELFVL